MRIVLMSERLSPPLDEGIKNVAAGLLEALRQRHDVLALTTLVQGQPIDGVIGIATNRLFLTRSLYEPLRRFRPDVVIYIPTASATPASFFRTAALTTYAMGAPIILVVTQGRVHNPLSQLVMRLLAPRVAVAFSEKTAHQLRHLGIAVTIAPIGVDTQRFTPATPEERLALRQIHHVPGNATVLLHVGHINANRNIPELSSLIENGRCLLVVGSTSTPEDRAVAYALRSAGAVLLREYRADIASLYRLADCYVFPVTAPTGAIDLPLSVLEAMACNLRVVTTRFGGLPTFFTEGEGLVFVNPGESLRCAVDRVLTHGIVRTRDQVMHLSWDAVARHILSTIGGERP